MRNTRRVLLSAALLAVPAAGTAQLTGHGSLGIGLAVRNDPVPWYGSGIGLAEHPVRDGGYAGVRFSVGLGFSGYNGGAGYGHHHGWDHYDCRDYLWYEAWPEPWYGCDPYYPVGYFGPWWGWHRPGWGFFGFFGWPSFRVVHHHWYGFSPFGYGGWSWYSNHYGWGWGWGPIPVPLPAPGSLRA